MNIRFCRILAFVFAVMLALSGCAAMTSPAQPDPTATAEPTAQPPREITLACFQEDCYESVKTWEILAAKENFMLEVVQMSLEDYWVLKPEQRPEVVCANGQDDLERIGTVMTDGTVRRFTAQDMEGLETLPEIMTHYKPLYHDGYGYLALPEAAWNDTVGQPDGQVLYFRSDWLSELEGVDYNNFSWVNFMDMMNYAALEDPDGNSVKDTKAIAVTGNLEDWLLDLFGVREWVLEDGKWIPGAVSSRARDALAWANQIRKENQLLVCDTDTQALEAFAKGQVAMLLWDGNAAGVAGVENVWAYVNGEDKPIEDSVSILPQPATPYGTRYLPVTQSSAFMMFDASLTDEEMQALLRVAEASWEESQAALDTYEVESYAEGVRDVMDVTWWVNAWKGPVFAIGVMNDDKITLQNKIAESFPAAIETLAFTNRFEEDWLAWTQEVKLWEFYEPAYEAVNNMADIRRFHIEE